MFSSYGGGYSFRISKRVQFFLKPFPLFFPPLIIPKPLANSNPNKQTKKKREKSQLKPLSVISRMLHRLHRRRHHLSIFEISITHTSVPTPLSRSVPFSPISNAVLRVSPTRGKSTHTEENCLSRGRERRPPFRGIARNMRGRRGI